jgi:SAM-dependent methyltransferase
MFFPDRVAALREMRRVLAQGGRIAVMTWGPLARCPGNAAMAQVWGQYFGAEQAAKFGPPHALHDPAEVRGLLEAAGFSEVEVHTQMGSAHFPSSRALARSYGALASLEADAATAAALCADLARLLQAYCGDAGLDYPIEAVLAWARQRNGA